MNNKYDIRYISMPDSGVAVFDKLYYNMIDKYDEIYKFDGDIAKIRKNKKWNYVNRSRHILSNIWFDWAGTFYNNIAIVEKNKKYNIISTNGKIIFDVWYDHIYSLNNDFLLLNIEINIILLILKENFFQIFGLPMLIKFVIIIAKLI